MITRRKFFSGAAALFGASALAQRIAGGAQLLAAPTPGTPATGSRINYRPVVTPNGSSLPWVMKDGVKEFHLIAEPVRREFAPGMMVNCWGYNGQSPGPTIEAVEGDRVRILVTNKLPEPTTVHWHGFILPNGMDGVGGLTQKHIPPGETYAYEFPLVQHGAQMYHPHSDEMTQMAMGMEGFFIIHPKDGYAEPVDRHFAIFLQEWAIEPGTFTPKPNVMTDFNIFTFNSRVWPGTDPLVIKRNERVRISFANLSMDSHPIHFHGHRWWIVETDGGQIPKAGWWPEATVNVPPGTTRTVEFVADNPGDWPVHCHKNHHAMNAMSHTVPNLIGANQKEVARKIGKLVPGYMAMGEAGMHDMSEMSEMMPGPRNTLPMMTGTGQFGPIEMGGMFTIMKVRDALTSYDDPGWYQNPPGTVASSIAGPNEEPKQSTRRDHS
ncbi:MAG TPA: copper oxidase [Chthoniobacterales bacterium]